MGIKINNKEIKSFVFPGGECHVDITEINLTDNVEVLAYIYNSDDLLKLLLVINAIHTQNSEARIFLSIPYFPYARQDRVCNKGEAFSLKVIVEIINNLKCDKVTIYDPHSEITTKLLSNCNVVSQAEILEKSTLESFIIDNSLVVLAPDKGSIRKIEEFRNNLQSRGYLIEYQKCFKIRDSKTGNIIETLVPDNLHNKNVIIVDDICDGGRTFIEIAKRLKEKGVNDIYLYVTHGIFSKGLELLKECFKHVYCYHAFPNNYQLDEKFLTIIGGKNEN